MTAAAAKNYNIAVIPGDGIGLEVVPQGIRVLEAAGSASASTSRGKISIGAAKPIARTGRMMPDDGLDQLRPFDAIFLGAVGHPGCSRPYFAVGPADSDPPRFRQYVNLRPVRLLAGTRIAAEKYASRGKSIWSSSAKTTKASIPKWAAGYTKARKRKWRCSKPSSPGAAWTASCATPSSWRERENRMSLPPRNRTASFTPCRSGMNAFTSSRRNFLTCAPINIT